MKKVECTKDKEFWTILTKGTSNSIWEVYLIDLQFPQQLSSQVMTKRKKTVRSKSFSFRLLLLVTAFYDWEE